MRSRYLTPFVVIISILLLSSIAFAQVSQDARDYIFRDNATIDRFNNAITIGDNLSAHGWNMAERFGASNDNDIYNLISGTPAIALDSSTNELSYYEANWSDGQGARVIAENYTIKYSWTMTSGVTNRELQFFMLNATSGDYLGYRMRLDTNRFLYNINGAGVSCALASANNDGEVPIVQGAQYNWTIYLEKNRVGCMINNVPCSYNCTLTGVGFDAIAMGTTNFAVGYVQNLMVFNGTSEPIENPLYPPIVTINAPLNNSVFNSSEENLTYSSLCQTPMGINFTFSMTNDTHTAFSVYNDTFVDNLSTLNGSVDLTNIGTGIYGLNFTCDNEEFLTSVQIISNITQYINPYPSLNITLIRPVEQETISTSSVPFILMTNISANCELFIDGDTYGADNIIPFVNHTHGVISLIDGGHDYFYQCDTSGYYFNSTETEFFVLTAGEAGDVTINFNQNATLSRTSCNGSGSAVGLLGLIMAIALVFLFMGFAVKQPMISLLGSLIFLFGAMYFVPCSKGTGSLMVFIGIILVAYSVFMAPKSP